MKKSIVFFALIFAACSSSDSKSNNNGDGPIILTSGECDGERNDGNEVCDGSHLGDETCESQGFGPGELKCAATCQAFDVTSCGAPESCGDNIIDEGEACDGSSTSDETCISLGYGEGVLKCASNCSGYDLTECGAPETCGNGVIDGDEVCDGEDLAGVTCASLELGDGAISCDANCLGLDTSICEVPLVCEPECPNGLSCERGVCVGPLDNLELNEVGFNVSGRIQVEGQTPSYGLESICNNENYKDYETARLIFREETKGYVANIDIECQDNFAFQTRLPEGTYEVRVTHLNQGNTQTNLFDVSYLAESALVVDQDLEGQIFNELGFNLAGDIQVEGQRPTYGNDSICNNANYADYETARLIFTEATKGYTANIDLECQDNFAFQTRLPKGTYEVRVAHLNQGNTKTNLFDVRYLAEEALVIDKNIGNAIFNEIGFNLAGKIQVEGQRPTYGNESICNNNNSQDYETARLVFIEATKGYRANIDLECQDNFDFQTRLPKGNYEVRVQQLNQGNTETNLFDVSYLAESALSLDQNISNAIFNELGFAISGDIKVEGQRPSYGSESICNNNNYQDYETARLIFTEATKGYTANIDLECQDNFAFTTLPKGTYEVRVAQLNQGNTETNLFDVRYLAEEALVVDQDLNNQIFDEIGFNVGGKIQVEGQRPSFGRDSICNNANYQDYETARVTFTEATKGYTANIDLKCQDGFAFQTRLPEGRYEVRLQQLNQGNTETNLFAVAYLAERNLVVEQDIADALFNEIGFNVNGKIQVEGQVPTYGDESICNNNNYADYETARVTFTEAAKGYRANIDIECQDNFDFQTRLPEGVYQVRVSHLNQGNTETNLFDVEYLAIDKLRVGGE